MNLKDHIKNYKFNSLVKVIIGKAELVGLIIQKEYVGPVYFYSCNVYGVYTKYRVLPAENKEYCFDLVELIKIKADDEDSHHYRWLHNNCKFLKSSVCFDMRVINND